ncbi:WxL protein peptidoglycan domain-containing protein, partial [Clostridium tepidum]
EQELTVNLKNDSDQEVIVIPTVGPAITNSNGVVEYGASKNYDVDKNAPMNMRDILTIENNQKEISLPAKSAKSVKFKLKIPDKAYDG